MGYICIMIKSMFKNNSRTLVNIIGVPLLLSSIYFGEFLFTTLIYFSIFVCIHELYKICLKLEINLQFFWLYFFSILLYLTHFFDIQELIILDDMQLFSLVCILIIITEFFLGEKNKIQNISATIFSIIWLIVFLNFIVQIRYDYGFEITLLMFLSVWICDTFAFVIGSKFGKKKIFPKISPNKTWMGTIAGYICSIIFVFFILQYRLVNIDFSYFNVFIIGSIFGCIGQIGDALESLIKRYANIKDSGKILRGHGGMLDRLDSLILSAPCFYIFLSLFA